MNKRLLVLFTMLFTLLPAHIYAAAPFVIGEGDSGDYQYTVIKGENTFTWKIGYQGHLVTIDENQENQDHLDRFRTAVNDLDSHFNYMNFLSKKLSFLKWCRIRLLPVELEHEEE